MLRNTCILICEDDPFIALDLATTVEDAGGKVLGPAASVREAMLLLDNDIAGAILDVNLTDGDVTPVVEHLLDLNVPFVIQTGTGLPVELKRADVTSRLFSKPFQPERLIGALLAQMEHAER